MRKTLLEFKKKKFCEVTDRIAFIGCTNKPWDGNTKELKNFFEKKFYFPFPNYSTRLMLFK